MSAVSGKRVLVAGAAGVIGRTLCKLLLADGWSVIGTTRSAQRAAELAACGVNPVLVDVFDAPALKQVVANSGAEIVVHQLTDLPREFSPELLAAALTSNAHLRDVGTRNLVSAAVAAGVKRVVAQSIAFAYAPGPRPYTEDSPLNVAAADTAAATTARGVQSLEQQVLAGPFVGVVLRYGRLYGPGTWNAVAATSGAVHVDAAAEAARLALGNGDGVYNIAEDEATICSRKARRELGWDPGFRLERRTC